MKAKRKSLRKSIKKYWQLWLLIIPAIIHVAIFSYGPMYGISLAFVDYKVKLGYLGSPFVGLKHFKRFLTYPGLIEMLKNTLSITLYNLAIFPNSIILALLFNELKNARFKKVVQMVTYAPHFLSSVVLCSLVTMLCGREGPLGLLYGFLTGGAPQNLLTIPEYFADIYIWSGEWANIGWSTIIYLAALAGVSPELVEAARIDGANRLQVIWHVNIPCILPTIVITFIMNCGSIISVGFEKIFLLQNDLNLEASRVISTYVYEIGLIGGQVSYSTAIGLFNNLVNIAALLLVNRITKKVSGMGLW